MNSAHRYPVCPWLLAACSLLLFSRAPVYAPPEEGAVPGLQPVVGEAKSVAKLEETLRQCREVLQKNPNDQANLRRMVLTLFDLGRFAEALDLLNRVPGDMPRMTGQPPPAAPAPAAPTPAAPAGKVAPVAPAPAPVPVPAPVPGVLAPPAAVPPRTPVAPKPSPEALERARQQYEAALKRNPGDEVALRGLVQSLFDLNRYDEALRVLDEHRKPSGPAPGAPPEVQARPPVKTAPETAPAAPPELAALKDRLAKAEAALAAQTQEQAKLTEASRQKEVSLSGLIEDLDKRVQASAKDLTAARRQLEQEKQRSLALTNMVAAARAQSAELNSRIEKERAAREKAEQRRAKSDEALRKKSADAKAEAAKSEEKIKDTAKALAGEQRKSRGLESKAEELSREVALSGSKLDDLAAKLQAEQKALAEATKAPAAAETAPAGMRALEVDLDRLCGDTPAQTEVNLGRALGRALELKVNTVLLRAFSDANEDGTAEAVYFSNRVVRTRADLLPETAAQFRNRGIAVYACMPVLAIELRDSVANGRLLAMEFSGAGVRPAADRERRLSPFCPQAMEAVAKLYEDLAAQAPLDGIVFGSDAYLTDAEDANAEAPARCRETLGKNFSCPASLTEARKVKWARLKTRQINEFIAALAGAARKRQPQLRFARTVFAPVVHRPQSEEWLAQNYADAMKGCDLVVLALSPEAEQVRQVQPWLKQIVQKVGERPDGLQKTVFKVLTRDDARQKWVSDRSVGARIQGLLQEGAEHVAFGPDDFEVNRPRVEEIKPALTLQEEPVAEEEEEDSPRKSSS